MCQCHTMWQSEGAMQTQVAHSKKIPLGEKEFLHGVPAVFRGVPLEGVGGYATNSREFFSTSPPRYDPHKINFSRHDHRGLT